MSGWFCGSPPRIGDNEMGHRVKTLWLVRTFGAIGTGPILAWLTPIGGFFSCGNMPALPWCE